jgi:hypothetical protein
MIEFYAKRTKTANTGIAAVWRLIDSGTGDEKSWRNIFPNPVRMAMFFSGKMLE